MTNIPRSIDEVDATWLSDILGSEVTSYNIKFLEGGVLADAFKVHDLTYKDASSVAPTSLVLKLANGIAERREFAVMTRAYIKEVRFFERLKDQVPLRTPDLYYIADDGKENVEFFVIAMEDLQRHSLVFDQVEDPPNEAFTRKINLEAAKFHAQYWESDVLKEDWLALPDGRYTFPLDEAARTCPEHIDNYLTLWSEMFGEHPYEGFPDIAELTGLLTGPKAAGLVDHMNGLLNARPHTLTHGDMRADNIFRTDPARGLSVDDSDLTYIDWQIIQPGPVGPEFSQAWQHSLPPEQRSKDMDFLKQYHDRLVQLQPAAAAYSYDMLIEDYRIGFLLWWMSLITLGVANLPGFATPEGARNKKLWGTGMFKMKHALVDHDCLDLVKKYTAEIG
jgi:hypothetical protein